MDLKEIKSYRQLDDFLFENDVELKCRERGFKVVGIDPGKDSKLTFTLSNRSQVECLAKQMEEHFSVAPLVKQ
ncbi:hypothetical protein [Bacillus sp. PK3_68]|uniref:hypothetical protein n=1 Tax=Bacillus sp. PK3_68 TaxID=2027408 RepID=UPI000E75E0C2|nr:hypothetical protein [Bacillus sp. PK3_68]RJS59269.1 hypothetical protein CJ483_03635 [Bacillus sp. PK3_68]